MSNDVVDRRRLSAVLVMLVTIALLILLDITTDYQAGAAPLHLFLELGIMTLAAAGAAALWWQLRSARTAVTALERDLAVVQREALRWMDEAKDLLEGLSAQIDGQFARWSLTPAERGIAMLLLKGLSHKEIAGKRQTAERTVREQARSVYEKAGLGGRAELSAFFLDGLLLPGADGAS